MLWSQRTVFVWVQMVLKQTDLCGCSPPRPTFPSKEAGKWDERRGGNIVLHCVMSQLWNNKTQTQADFFVLSREGIKAV